MADDKDFMSKESSAGKRKYLKSYETLPAQLLNCYGEAKFARMSDESLWTYVYLIFADALSLFSRVSQSLRHFPVHCLCLSLAREMQKELKSGALWMSELCDNTAERRGVGRSGVYSAYGSMSDTCVFT